MVRRRQAHEQSSRPRPFTTNGTRKQEKPDKPVKLCIIIHLLLDLLDEGNATHPRTLTDMATSGLSSEPTNDCDRTLYHARGQCDGETMKKNAKSVIYSVSHFRALGPTTNFIHCGTPHVPPSDRPVEMGNQVHTYLSTLEHAHTQVDMGRN